VEILEVIVLAYIIIFLVQKSRLGVTTVVDGWLSRKILLKHQSSFENDDDEEDEDDDGDVSLVCICNNERRMDSSGGE
jgi:hypothetical protein